MNAIRRDEETDNLHSIYVDQWDWEKVITRTERNEAYLERTAARIHAAVLEAENGAAQPLSRLPPAPAGEPDLCHQRGNCLTSTPALRPRSASRRL